MMLISQILDIFIFVLDVCLTVFIILNRILTLGSNQVGEILQTEKLEINLHKKANTCYDFPAMVKIIPDFGNGDPMR